PIRPTRARGRHRRGGVRAAPPPSRPRGAAALLGRLGGRPERHDGRLPRAADLPVAGASEPPSGFPRITGQSEENPWTETAHAPTAPRRSMPPPSAAPTAAATCRPATPSPGVATTPTGAWPASPSPLRTPSAFPWRP